MDECKYPHITVKLVGEDGNAFSILGRAIQAMRQGAVPQAEINEFRNEAMSGDYHHLLFTCNKWVNIE